MTTLGLLLFLFTNYQCLGNLILKNEVVLDNVLKNVFETCRKDKNPGMQVVVVRGGQTLFKKAYGVKDKNTLEEMDLKTLVGVGTLTKSMANLLLLRLIQTNSPKKDINTPLKKIFDGRNLFGLSYLRSKYATPADVMSHRIGFPNHNYLRLNNTFQRNTVNTSFTYMRPAARFRDSYIHNNILFSIIIHMAERLGGKDWEILAKDQLFSLIGMKNADFLTTFDPNKANVATPYLEHHGQMHEVDFNFLKMWEKLCSGCVLASANDMAEYMQFIIKGGKVKFSNGTTVQLIPKSDMNVFKKTWMRLWSASVNEHFTKATGLPHSRMHFGYGLGLKTGEYRGHSILEESGDSMGHSTIITIFPETRLGIYIALSGEDPDDYFRTTVSSYIADLYHQEEPWLNATSLCTFPMPFRVPKPKKPDTPIPDTILDRKPNEYVGDYYNKLYGFVRVRATPTGKLILGYGPVVFDLRQTKPKSLRFHMVGRGGAKHTITNARMVFKQAKFQLDPVSPFPPSVQKRINRPIDRLVVLKFGRTEFKRLMEPEELMKSKGIADVHKNPIKKKPNNHQPTIKTPQTQPAMHQRPKQRAMHQRPKQPAMHQRPKIHKTTNLPKQIMSKPKIHKQPNILQKPRIKPESPIGVPVTLG